MSKSGKKSISKTNESQQKRPEIENTGQYLRKLRTDKGLSVKEVSESTRISEVNLNAIEAQDFSSLPADTFTRGLLSIYADFLGTDPAHITSQFMQERDERSASGKRSKAKQSKKLLAPKMMAEPSHISSMTMAGILLVVIIVLFTGFCLYTSWNPFSFLTKKTEGFQSVMMSVLPGSRTEEAQPEPPPVQKSPNTHAQESTAEAVKSDTVRTEAPPAQPPANKYTINVTFLKDTEVSLTLDKNETTELEFTEGETQTWSAKDSLKLSFAIPESALIRLNDTPVVFPEHKNGYATFSLPKQLGNQQGDE